MLVFSSTDGQDKFSDNWGKNNIKVRKAQNRQRELKISNYQTRNYQIINKLC